MVIEIVVEDRLILSTRDLQKIGVTAYKTLQQIFTYKNPKFIENERYGYSNHNVSKHLYSYEILDGKMYISRGGREKVVEHLKKFQVIPKFIDRTLVCESVSFEHSKTVLRPEQDKFVSDLLKYNDGCGIAYTSFGKTLSLLELARKVGQPTLVLVHTTFLQKQWIKEATDPKTFNISRSEIGGVGGVFGGKKRKLGKLNVCLYHSLANPEHRDFFKDKIGLLIFDEGQKSPIEGVQEVVNHFRARYRYTASAQIKRKDGKEFLTFDTFGPIRHIAKETNSDSKILSKIKLIPSSYEDPQYEEDNQYTGMISRMGTDKERNIMICKLALRQVKKGRLVLIFVERKSQAGILAKYLSKFRVGMLLGPVNKKAIADDPSISKRVYDILSNYDDKTAYDVINAKAERKEIDIIIGTQKAEVGLSIRTIDHAIVTTPAGGNQERFKQMIGRVERTYSSKQEEYFGHKKPTPTVDVIVDTRLRPSKNAALNIKETYGKRVKKGKL
jgi:superfamily II DNA or RNA helicase